MDSRSAVAWSAFTADPWIQLVVGLVWLWLVALYLASIFWTVEEARRRTASPILPYAFGALALLPYFGVLLYLVVRPQQTRADSVRARASAARRRLRPVAPAQPVEPDAEVVSASA